MHARALVLVALLLAAPLTAQALTQKATNPVPAPTAGIYSLACVVVFEESGTEFCDHAGQARRANALQIRVSGTASVFVWVEKVLPDGSLYPFFSATCAKDCFLDLRTEVTGPIKVEATVTGTANSRASWSIGQSFGNLLV